MASVPIIARLRQLTRFHDLTWRHHFEQGALRACVPPVFIDLLEIVSDRCLAWINVALPIDDSLDSAPLIGHHGIRNPRDEDFARLRGLVAEDRMLGFIVADGSLYGDT